MKKIFTLLFAAGSITFASAQSMGQKNSPLKDNQREIMNMNTVSHPSIEKGKSSNYETSSFSLKEKEKEIQKINYTFDQKIEAVKKSRYLRANEKSKQIRTLENQRNTEIRQVQARFEKSNQRNNDKGFDKNNSHKW